MRNYRLSNMRRIIRIENPKHGHKGWKVVFRGKKVETKGKKKIIRRNIITSEFFADIQHGGKENALDAAIAWRDAGELIMKPSYDGWLIYPPPFYKTPTSANKSGVVGVHFTEGDREYTQRSDVKQCTWTATWVENGDRKIKHFSCRQMGYNAAFQSAKAEREAAEERIKEEHSDLWVGE